MFCASCGSEIKEGNAFCTNCGVRYANTQVSAQSGTSVYDPYKSPGGNTILTFGILGLMGLMSCGLLCFFGIPAWIMGNTEIKKYPKDERVKAGKIMGIISCIMLVLAIIAGIIVFALVLKNANIFEFPNR